MNSKAKAWITAFRLRTLPLALSCIGMGSFLAAAAGAFRWDVFMLCLVTTLFLQILSNLANDYGDSVSGVDGEHRAGPSRTVQDGLISRDEMKRSLYLFSMLSFLSGIGLLWVALGNNMLFLLIFVGIGLAAIFAAIKYTSGKNPYGYVGLGDLSVFLFFGIVGVAGTYFLFTQSFDPGILLPAITCGFFAVAVLNLNNIRDIKSDELAGKRSIPVRLGREKSIYYHWFLLIAGFLSSVVYILLNYKSPVQFGIILILPLLFVNGKAVLTKKEAMALDPYLKQMAISTLLFVIIFGLSNVLLS